MAWAKVVTTTRNLRPSALRANIMRPFQKKEGRRAFTLIDTVAALGLLGIFAAIGVPPLQEMMAATELRLATSEVAAAFYEARVYALRHSANVAVRFAVENDAVSWSLYRDGDGDGVLSEDILRGIDHPVRGSRRLAHFGSRIHFGFPAGKEPTEIGDPTRRIKNLEDPIRFNRSDMASFSSLGTATPGTAYVTDGKSLLMAVRITSLSAKVTLWEYDRKIQRWRRKG